MVESKLEEIVVHTPIISTHQLPESIQKEIIIDSVPKPANVSREELEELYEDIEEHKSNIKNLGKQEKQPNGFLLSTYRTIDSILPTRLADKYESQIRTARSRQTKQLEADHSKRTYELLQNFRGVVEEAANEYQNAMNHVAEYINHIQELQTTKIPQIINEQNKRITYANDRVSTINKILHDEQTPKARTVAKQWYAGIENELNRVKNELKDAQAIREFLTEYKTSYYEKRLGQAKNVFEKSLENIPYLRELAIEVDSAIMEYEGLTEPAQQISLALDTFQVLSDLKDQLNTETNNAARNVIHDSEVYQLNQETKKQIRGS